MANMRARHAFGKSGSIEAAKQANKIDAYDILFLDGDTDKPKIGWLDAQGNTVIVPNKDHIVRVDVLPTVDGDENVVYIYNNECYIWDGSQCIPMCKPTDLTALEKEIETKVDAETVQSMIDESYKSMTEVVEF